MEAADICGATTAAGSVLIFGAVGMDACLVELSLFFFAFGLLPFLPLLSCLVADVGTIAGVFGVFDFVCLF